MEKQPSVRLMMRVRIGQRKYRYVNPVMVDTKRGKKLKAQYAEIDGKQEHHPEARYALRFWDKGKRIFENVGSDPDVASIKFDKKKRELAAKAVGIEIVEQSVRRSLQDAVEEFIQETQSLKSHKTYLAYSKSIMGFAKTCSKSYLEDLDRKDILDYIAYLKGSVNARTVANRIENLKTFYRHFKLPWPLDPKDMPKYTEKMVQQYDDEQIRSIMSAANQEEFELLQFFLCTGGREKDVQYATWKNINLITNTFWIEENADIGYTPKDREEGAIPIPDFLIDLLRARKARSSNSQFIFPTESGKPNGHLLRIIKRLALRAGLNCGSCKTKRGLSCKDHPVCKRWILHKWRKTFATRHHEAGVPVRTIQRWLRHSDLETTLRYLACTDDQSPATRQKVNSTFAGLFGPALVPKSA